MLLLICLSGVYQKPQELTDTFAVFGPVSYVRVKHVGFRRRGYPSQFNYGLVQLGQVTLNVPLCFVNITIRYKNCILTEIISSDVIVATVKFLMVRVADFLLSS